MQLKQSIIETFNKKGYFPTSMITQRQFHILMNTFIASSHTVFDENITQEIWKQSEQRNQQLYGKSTIKGSSSGINQQQLPSSSNSKKNNPILTSTKQQKPQLKCQLIISTLIDAIQILTNRILQCECIYFLLLKKEHLEDLKSQRQQVQHTQNYSKLESIKQKIQSITSDLKLFEKEFKMLSEPFLNEGSKKELKKQLSIKRSQTVKRRVNVQKQKKIDEDQQFSIEKQQQQYYSQRQQHNKTQQINISPQSPRLRKSPFKEQKQCGLVILTLLSILQLSVCLVKFNFVNLLIELLGFLVLVQDNYLPNMMKSSVYSCMFSVLLDTAWLVIYSPLYVHPYTDTSLHHSLKPYHHYTWFATLLQLFIKLIYLYVLRSYSNKSQSFYEQQRIKLAQQENAEIRHTHNQ